MKFSVIIPVLNEPHINNTIAQLKTQGNLEIIIADEISGSTNKKIKHRVKKIRTQTGRARQMNAGAKHATGDALIFLHADTTLPANALSKIENALKDRHAGGFALVLDTQNPLLKLIARATTLRSQITRIPRGDQAQFFKANYFHAIGGYKDIPLFEDTEMMQRIKKRGDKISIIKAPVTSSARRWQKEGIIYTTLRNWTIRALFGLGVKPEKLVGLYRSHE